jgi:phosphopantothenoylcysteine decarboxylase/phosphopantothenate--cysteine ligase
VTASALAGREVLLVVGGGISAFKSALVARELQRRGALVETVLTAAAQRFVTGVTFAGITGRAARVDLWDPSYPGELHIALAAKADVVLVAPATADLMARMAHGLGDDLATTCLLAARGPVVVAPAMHPSMWEHAATRANAAALHARGVAFAGPVVGPLASGESGIGRMAEPEAIVDAAARAVTPQDLVGRRVVVSAGGTHEAIDPVRFVGNRSSGRMGYAVAARARARGAAVVLVSGPTALPPPEGVTVQRVQSAREMRDAVLAAAASADLVVMAAAVADYRPADVAAEKIKKSDEAMVLRLVKNPDILAELGAARREGGAVLVGFALETSDLVERAREKLERKRCDLVVANLAADGFDGDENLVTLVTRDAVTALARMSKSEVADHIIDHFVALGRA